MTETQIYKWWWDQTRKRMRKLKAAAQAKAAATQPVQPSNPAQKRQALGPSRLSASKNKKPISDVPRRRGGRLVGTPAKKELRVTKERASEEMAALAGPEGFLVPAIDEFGGYSSRLRIPEVYPTAPRGKTSGAQMETLDQAESPAYGQLQNYEPQDN